MNVLLIILIAAILLLLALLFRRHRSDTRERKISTELVLKNSFQPPSGKKSEQSVFQIYGLLSAWMSRKNSLKSFEKQSFVVIYLNNKFKVDSLDIAHELDLVNTTSIHVRSVANWIVQKMTDARERADLIDFLIDLVFVDGDMIDREFTALIRLGELIGVRSMYIENKVIEFRKRIFGKDSASRLHEIANGGTRRKFALAILDLGSNATDEEIKKRYRTLVKKYHPDRNPDLSEEDQAVHAQRFLEVQDAYEELISN